jgi:ketosteroid isomerase-like protein
MTYIAAHTDLSIAMDAYTAAVKRGDIAAALEFWADDIILHAPGTNRMSGVYCGKVVVKRYLIDRVYEETSRAEMVRVMERQVGTNHVFMVARQCFEKPDGRRLEIDRLIIYRWDDGKIADIRFFDRDQAATDAFWGPPSNDN